MADLTPAEVRALAATLALHPSDDDLDEVERVLVVARGDARATEVASGRRVWRTGGHLHADPRN